MMVASAMCVTTTYFYFVYWADIVASYSNYFVSMLVVPLLLALLVGYLSTLFDVSTKRSKLVIFISPSVCTLILVLVAYLILQYGIH